MLQEWVITAILKSYRYTYTHAYANSERDISVFESVKRNLLPWISVTYFCQRHEIYDHCVFIVWSVKSRRQHQRRGESYSLPGRRLWPIADIWLRRRRRRRLRNFCDASPRSPPPPIVLFTVPKFVDPFANSIIRMSKIRRTIFEGWKAGRSAQK